MSLLSGLGNIFKGVVKAGRTALTGAINVGVGYLTGGTAGALTAGAGALLPAVLPKGTPSPTSGQIRTGAPVTGAGAGAGGVAQTLPQLRPPSTVPVGKSPTPGGLMQSLGQGLAQIAAGRIPGGGAKRGRLTGNAIPRGYVERMSPSGVIYLAKQRRRRGISSRDISSFYRVSRLVSKIHGRAHRAPRGRK